VVVVATPWGCAIIIAQVQSSLQAFVWICLLVIMQA
jgi:hypothetical protein